MTIPSDEVAAELSARVPGTAPQQYLEKITRWTPGLAFVSSV